MINKGIDQETESGARDWYLMETHGTVWLETWRFSNFN